MTGEGVALPVEISAEVENLQRSLEAELKPSGDMGRVLVRRMALLSVRMDRSVAQESASLAVRVREAEEDFDADWPMVEGVDDPERARRRAEAANLALFDPSKQACLARKYEAAAERGFFRALKELRQVERQAKATGPGQTLQPLGSSLSEAPIRAMMVEKPAETPRKAASTTVTRVEAAPQARFQPLADFPFDLDLPMSGAFELPFSIGRAG